MGRGRSKSEGALGGASGKPINIKSQTDVWTYRHNPNNEPFVDSINGSVRDISNDFPGIMNDINVVNSAELGGADKVNTLGFYSSDQKSVSLNENYTNINKMNAIYDQSVKENYHPSRGSKNGTEAVTYHEMGHALTDYAGKKFGAKNIDDAAKKIVDDAYRNSKGRNTASGTKAWARKISGYATESNAECIAEAVCDWYCNGSKAKAQSKAIMTELMKYK